MSVTDMPRLRLPDRRTIRIFRVAQPFMDLPVTRRRPARHVLFVLLLVPMQLLWHAGHLEHALSTPEQALDCIACALGAGSGDAVVTPSHAPQSPAPAGIPARTGAEYFPRPGCVACRVRAPPFS